ncbi:MAG: SulP family inorganic anion transporter [Anaerolineae bacterium]
MAAKRIARNLFAGVITGLVNVVFSISYAALIFAGPLSDYLSVGVTIALFSATIFAIIVAWGSSFNFAIGAPDSNAAVITALLVASAAGMVTSAANLLPTIVALLVVTTVATGAVVFGAGWLKLGGWIRFSPYPVVGGFLAGTGWLLVRGSFVVMTGVPLTLSQLDTLIQPVFLLMWLPGVIFGALIVTFTNRTNHYLVLPGAVVSAVALFYGVFWAAGISVAQARQMGWLFEPFSRSNFMWMNYAGIWPNIEWNVLLAQSGSLFVLIFVVIIVMLFSTSGIELVTNSDADYDRELMVTGLSNIAVGFFGGIIGGISTSRTLLNHKAGADGRLSGFTVAAVCALMLLGGASVLAYIPRPVIGGVLFSVGGALLVRWLATTRRELTLVDYSIIWIILLVVIAIGFLEGIAVGVIIASVIFTISYSRFDVIKYKLTGADHRSNRARPVGHQQLLKKHGRRTLIFWLQGYLFFGTASRLLDEIVKDLHEASEAQYLLLDFRQVSGLDVSAMLSFAKLRRIASTRQINLIYTNLSPEIAQQFERGGLIEPFVENQIFPDLDRGLEWVENQLLATYSISRRQRNLPLALQIDHLMDSVEELTRFINYLTPQEFADGSTVIEKGRASPGLYFVESGEVTVYGEFGRGRTRRIRTMGAGTIMGELGLYRGTVPMATVVATQPCRMYLLSEEALAQMESLDPTLAAAFHKFIARLIAERLVIASETIDLLLS